MQLLVRGQLRRVDSAVDRIGRLEKAPRAWNSPVEALMGSRLHVKPISQHLLAVSWLLLAFLAAKIGYDEYQGAQAAGYLAFPAWQSTLFFEALAVVGIALIAL